MKNTSEMLKGVAFFLLGIALSGVEPNTYGEGFERRLK